MDLVKSTRFNLQNRLLRQSFPTVLGSQEMQFSASLCAEPKLQPNTCCISLTLNNQPAWLSLAWGDLNRLTKLSLEALPSDDAALLIEESISIWLDEWEANCEIEVRLRCLEEAAEGRTAVRAGLLLQGPTWRSMGLLRLSLNAAEVLIASQEPNPRSLDQMPELMLSASLEFPGTSLTLAEASSLSRGDALLLPDMVNQNLLVLENQMIANVAEAEDGSVTLTSNFQPRRKSKGTIAMSDNGVNQGFAASDPTSSSLLSQVGDIEVRLAFRIGEALIPVADLQTMGRGTTIPLDRPDGNLVDITVNGQVIGNGELIQVSGQRAVEIRKIFSNG